MLTKKQLEDAIKCRDFGTGCCDKNKKLCSVGGVGICIENAARTALAYREMLEKIVEWAGQNITPPAVVQAEHKELVKTIDKYIEGNEVMYQSINLTKGTFNKEQFIIGVTLIEQSKDRIIRIIDKMRKKIREVI